MNQRIGTSVFFGLSAIPPERMLREVGMPPIPHATIAAYRQTQLDNARQPTRVGKLLDTLHIAPFFGERLVGAFPLIVCLFGLMFMVWAAILVLDNAPRVASAGALSVGISMIVGGMAFSVQLRRYNFIYPARWASVSWTTHYRQHKIPLQVIEQQRLLQGLFPNAEFRVHELRQGSFMIDPILSIKIDKTNHFVSVWDENGEIVEL